MAHRRMLWLGLLLFTATGGAPALGAQVLVGTVAEDDGGRPVVGAVVRAVADPSAAAGIPVPSGPATLTDAAGRYRLQLPEPGSYVLLVERIGFASVRTDPVRVADSGVVVHDVQVSAAPVELGGLSVEVEGGRCERAGGEGGAEAVQRVWDEARKALTAARITEAERALRFRIVTRERTLSPRSLAVVDEERRVSTGWGGNPVRSLPVDDLSRGGYVREGADGMVDYYAPDAAVLLSDEFLQDHCFRLAAPRDDEPELLGLAFEPTPDREVPDIEGVVWLERETGRLQRLVFTYTGLPSGPGADDAGGEVHFTELPDGRWIVSRWWIRAPVVAEVRSSTRFGSRSRRVVQSILERGSEALEARGGTLEWAASAPPAALRGLVYDSLEEAPLAGATVRLAGRGWRTTSDPGGRFELTDLPGGTYRLTFEHPRLDTLGLELPDVEVELVAGDVAERTLAIPSRASLAMVACGGGPTIYGRVTDRSGAALPGVAVEGVPLDAPEGSDAGAVEAYTDADGWYRLCGVISGEPYAVVARMGRVTSDAERVEGPSDAAGRVDLSVRGRARIAAGPAEGAGAPLYGRAVDAESEEPVSEVLVTLLDDDDRTVGGTLTDAEGRFTLPAGPGAHRVRAEHLGYGTLESEAMDVGPRGRRVELRMAPRALEVEGLVVEVEARDMRLDRVGFYRRELLSGGTFLHREDVEAIPAMETSDVLLTLPGVRRLDMASVDLNTAQTRIQLRGATRASGRQNCVPAVYVDGALLRRGDDLTPENAGDIPFLDDLVGPHQIRAVEIYETPATVPARFNAQGALCGVIVIWTHGGGQ